MAKLSWSCIGVIFFLHLNPLMVQGKFREETADCFEVDTDFQGHDIFEIPFRGISSSDQCYLLCKKEKFCHAWTWTPDQDCFLKDGLAFLNRVSMTTLLDDIMANSANTGEAKATSAKESEYYLKLKKLSGKISGPKECSKTNLFKCYDVGTNFEGYDIQKLESGDFESPQECHYRCGKEKNCYYWSWDATGKNCYLKVNDATMGWRKDATTKNFVSGAGICGQCFEPSTDYRGHDILKMENEAVVSADQCRTYCVRNRNCFFWTWVPQTERCYLKDRFALDGRVADEDTHGMVSGAKNCENHGRSEISNLHLQLDNIMEENASYIDVNNSSMTNRNKYISLIRSKTCYHLDTDYTGYDIVRYENGDVSTSQDCQRLCKQNDKCFYWTWNGNNSFCYLKSYGAYKGQKKDQTTIGKVSATKLCPCPGF